MSDTCSDRDHPARPCRTCLGRNRVDSWLDQALEASLSPPCTRALTASPRPRRITGGQRARLTPTLAFAPSTAPFRAPRRGGRRSKLDFQADIAAVRGAVPATRGVGLAVYSIPRESWCVLLHEHCPSYVLDSFACVTQLRVGQKGWRRVYWTMVLVTWAPAGAPWSWHRARTDTKVQSTLARRVAHPRVT